MHGTTDFRDCQTMGELTAKHVSALLEIEPTGPDSQNSF
jgi:hypothetical protein